VRTFFHTNKSTCGEWLTRIRTAVVVVAIHAGQATTAIRHGHCMLQDMADANNTQVCWSFEYLLHVLIVSIGL
jgi:PI-3-kinase-related kinase SMG-1